MAGDYEAFENYKVTIQYANYMNSSRNGTVHQGKASETQLVDWLNVQQSNTILYELKCAEFLHHHRVLYALSGCIPYRFHAYQLLLAVFYSGSACCSA